MAMKNCQIMLKHGISISHTMPGSIKRLRGETRLRAFCKVSRKKITMMSTTTITTPKMRNHICHTASGF